MTADTIDLLPPPMELVLGSSVAGALPSCTPNLMPFSIDYNGSAPVDSFLLLRAASGDEETHQQSGSGPMNSFVSAFRGRAIQSTPLPLPSGYRAALVRVEELKSPSAQPSTSTLTASVDKEDEERSRKKQRTTRPPVKQQKFSMDSDDDEANDSDREEHSEPDASPAPEPPAQQAASKPLQERQDDRAAARVRIAPIAKVQRDELRIWGPDGPVDRGDDTLFRTVGEWLSTVAPTNHEPSYAACRPLPAHSLSTLQLVTMVAKTYTGIKCLPGQGSGRAARAAKRYRAQRSALERISKNSIRRLARRGGVTRMGGMVYDETRFILRDFLTRAVRDAIVYSGESSPLSMHMQPVRGHR